MLDSGMDALRKHVLYVEPCLISIMTIMERSTRQEVFCKQDVIKNFTKFNGNKCSRFSFLIKPQAPGLQLCIKRNSGTGIFL